jgi:hypothetical protein
MNGAATAVAERETGFPDAGRRQTPSIKSPPPGAAEVICEDGLACGPATQSLRRLMSAADDRAAEGIILHLETTVLDLSLVVTSASSLWLSPGQELSAPLRSSRGGVSAIIAATFMSAIPDMGARGSSENAWPTVHAMPVASKRCPDVTKM